MSPSATSPSAFSTVERTRIRKRANGRCERCSLPMKRGEAHHRKPRGMGGSDDPVLGNCSNGLWLCEKCHRWIESHRAESLKMGWLIASGPQEPWDVPVKLWDGWFVLGLSGLRASVEVP